MATVLNNKEKRALNRLLMTIGGELHDKESKKLLSLYDVKPSEAKDPYHELKELVCMVKEDLHELVENLATIKRDDVSKKVTQFIEEHFGTTTTSQATLVEPVTETRPPNTECLKEPIVESGPSQGEGFKTPIQEQVTDGLSETVQRQSIIPEYFRQSRNTHPRKKPRLDIQECDSTYNSDEDEELSLEAEAEGEVLMHMQKAIEVSRNSPDENTKVGAVLVNPDGKVIGEGYNRMPRGCDHLPWNREGDPLDTKYPYVTHAAVTAIQEAYKNKEDTKGSTLYTTMYPSSRDAVIILEAEVKEMVYMENMKRDSRKRYHTGATKRLLDDRVICRQVSMAGSGSSV